jgi:5'-nucleotidase/UDP-sugar diphosphatase
MILLLSAALMLGCLDPTPEGQPIAGPSPLASSPATPASRTREIVILHTNDEHGYLLPQESDGFGRGGAAYAAGGWLRKGLDPNAPNGNVLLVSGGDNWTGAAISTWFRGESTIAVMNAMGYRASVIGNHEFDFGQETLRQRARQAQFPYLAANLYRSGTQEIVDFARPYRIIEVNGVTVGVIGLALKETPLAVNAKNLEGLAFGDYEPALRRWVPVMRHEGAQVIVLVSHICPIELLLLAPQVADLELAVMLGGHCHEAMTTSVGDTLIAASSAHWRDYVLARLTFDTQTGRVTRARHELVEVRSGGTSADAPPDPRTQAVVEIWEQRVQLALGEVLGYSRTGLDRFSPALQNLLVDSWLWAFPDADIAISNVGGFRQDLKRGTITLGDVVSTLPFENEVLEIRLSGAQVRDVVSRYSGSLVWGGLRRSDGQLVLAKGGATLKADAMYRVLIIDYVYYGSSYPFQRYDKQPYETSVSWRQPLIDWVRAQHSTQQHPLEGKLDMTQRY